MNPNKINKVRVSPGSGQRFPFISLPRAIERIKELHKFTGKHETSVNAAAVNAWNYSEKSSSVGMIVAALKSFGLVEDFDNNEARKIKLTATAVKIIVDPREVSPDRDELIRLAALKPVIHSEIFEKYNGLPPSNEAFKAYLLLDRSFKTDAANNFIKEFNETMEFAKISDSNLNFHRENTHNPVEPSEIDEQVPAALPPETPSSRTNFSSTLLPLNNSSTNDELNRIKIFSDEDYITVTAHVDLEGLKRLIKRLQRHLDILEEEMNENN